MSTIPHKYRAGLHSGAHRFDHDLARAQTYKLYYMNSVLPNNCLPAVAPDCRAAQTPQLPDCGAAQEVRTH